MRLPLAWALLSFSVLLGFGSLGCSPSVSVSKGLEVHRAEIGLMPGDGPAVAYVTVANGGESDDRLVAVETPFASQAEMHESIDDQGVVKMIARPEGFLIPAGETLELEPGGKHIMLFEPQSEGVSDGQVSLILHFENGGLQEVRADVVRIGGGQHAGMDHGDMSHGTVGDDGADHGVMNHDSMDHGSVDHSSMDHGEKGSGKENLGESVDSGASAPPDLDQEPPPAERLSP